MLARARVALAALCLARPAHATVCDDQEAAGIYDVTCWGADPATGNNDTDAVWVTLCHLWRNNPGIATRTLLFPAGEFRVNLVIGWDDSLATAPHHVIIKGAGIDSTRFIKDGSKSPHSGSWTDIGGGTYTHTLDPALCRGEWLHDIDTNGGAITHRATRFFLIGDKASDPPDLTFEDIAIVRSLRELDSESDDEGIRFGSQGTLTMTRAELSGFFLGARLDWGPLGESYDTPQSRPQRFVADHSRFSEMVYGVNGDGTYSITNSAFSDIGGTTFSTLGKSIYLKRIHGLTCTNNTWVRSGGYAVVLDNDHATGSEPAFVASNVNVVFQRNTVTDHNAFGIQGDVLLSVVNNRVTWNVSNNTFTGVGYLKFYGRLGMTFANNRVDQIGLYFNWQTPDSPDVMRPDVRGNLITRSFVYARTTSLAFAANHVFDTDLDVVTGEESPAVETVPLATFQFGGSAL